MKFLRNYQQKPYTLLIDNILKNISLLNKLWKIYNFESFILG